MFAKDFNRKPELMANASSKSLCPSFFFIKIISNRYSTYYVPGSLCVLSHLLFPTSSPSYKWGNQGTQRLSSLHKVKQLVSDRAGIQLQSQAPESVVLSLCYSADNINRNCNIIYCYRTNYPKTYRLKISQCLWVGNLGTT